MSEDTTALTVQDQSAAALTAFGFTEGEPLKPSRLDLIQPIQIADEPGLVAGKFRDAQSNLQYDTINIVPILMDSGRVLFPPGGELGAQPVCRSRDGIMPVIDDERLVRQDSGNGCAKCKMSQWKKIGGKSIKPPCQETQSFLFAELETQFVYRMNAKGMALAPTKDLKETIRKIVLAARARGGFAPPYGLTFQLSSIRVKGSKGTYFIPKYKPTGQVHPDDLAKFASIYNFFSSRKGVNYDEEEVVTDPVESTLQGEYVESSRGYEAA